MNLKNSRLSEIDLLRFIAAFAVMLFHYSFRGAASDDLSPISSPALASFFKYGFLGVNLFFIISGFVILMSSYGKTTAEFIASRATRLYPEFWICVTVTAIASVFLLGDPYEVTLPQYLVNLTMASNLFKTAPIDGVYWTLFIEMKFYFLMFLVIAVKKIREIKKLLLLWLALSWILTWKPLPGLSFLFMPEFSPYFIAGAFFYLAHKEGFSAVKIGAIGTTYPLALIHAYRTMLDDEMDYAADFSFQYIAAAIALFYALFWYIAVSRRQIFSEPAAKLVMILGGITYPLYLLHQHLGYMLFYQFEKAASAETLIWIASALMIGLALFVDHARKPFSRRFKNAVEKILRIKKKKAGADAAGETPSALAQPEEAVAAA